MYVRFCVRGAYFLLELMVCNCLVVSMICVFKTGLSVFFSLLIVTLSHGAQSGPFTYEVVGDNVKITRFTTPAQFDGHLVVPAQLEGKPVTEIGVAAVIANSALTKITLPNTLLKIGNEAFYQCNNVSSIDFGNSLEEIGELAFFISYSLKSVVFPASLKVIGERAFEDCKLRKITLPAGMTRVSRRAFWKSDGLTDVVILGGDTKFEFGVFQDCENLQNVRVATRIHPDSDKLFYNCYELRSILFESNAPAVLPELQGSHTSFASTFAIYFMEGKTGFTTPTWQNYPCVMLKPGVNPFARDWLIGHNLDPDVDMSQDVNGDGHSLLMAYALQLDPKSNLGQILTEFSLDSSNLKARLSYYALTPGVSYIVEKSSDLTTWSSVGVSHSDVASDGKRVGTASFFQDSGVFLRLSVNKN